MNITETVHTHLPAQYAEHAAARAVIEALVERERTIRQRITEAAEEQGIDATDLLDELGMEAQPAPQATTENDPVLNRLAEIERTLTLIRQAAARHGVTV